MKLKILCFTVFLILIIILLFYLKCNTIENFESDKYSAQNLVNMFNSLEVAEQRCTEIEERNKIKYEKEQIEYNESTFHELEELDKKILELKNIVKLLSSKEKQQSDKNNSCRKEKEKHLDKNYDFIKKLEKDDLLQPNNVNFELNLSDALKKNLNSPGKKCDIKNTKDYVNIDKNKLSDKCYNCDGNKLKQNLPYIYNNFD